MKNRIEYLDGHRGLAILLVVFFHAYARWPTLVPYGDQLGNFPVFKYGWLGVELFFLISGFVILMTLEKCSTAKEFLTRRWLRLFPAMLVCSGIIFLTSNYFSERPAGSPGWESLLPGLTFVEPDWWSLVIGRPVTPMEGAFWSLYVEFKFYFFAAILYFWKGRNTLIRALVLVFFVATYFRIAEKHLGFTDLTFIDEISAALSFQYFGWFASGASFYVFSQTRSSNWFAMALLLAIASSVATGGTDWRQVLAAGFISLLFAASTVLGPVQTFLNNRVVQLFGFVSYPLYLIHENMMVSIIIKLGHKTGKLPPALLPLAAIAMLSTVAFLLARYCEPWIKTMLIRALPRKPQPT